MIKWNYIQDSQPEHGRSIVRVEYDDIDGFGYLCITDYYQYKTTWKELCKYREDNSMSPLSFWWIYKEDFPFPDKI